jgi:hypothetical protein
VHYQDRHWTLSWAHVARMGRSEIRVKSEGKIPFTWHRHRW